MIDDPEHLRSVEAHIHEASPHNADQSPAQQLLAFLETEYIALHLRLSSQLRSAEAAAEALHDVYLKLSANPRIEDVRYPRSYLYRMAINIVHNQRRKAGRAVSADDAITLLIADDAPDPEHVALATDELNRAITHLHALPAQRRQIFLARWRDEKTQIEIASEFGLHKRTVQKELERAERYLRKKLWRPDS